MTLRMNGVGRTRNIMQREKERERERESSQSKKKERKKAKTNSQSQNEHTNTLLSPPISRPIRCHAKSSQFLKQKSRSENKRHAPQKRSTRPGISKLISTPDPHTASPPATAPPQPPLTATTTTTVAKLPPRRLRRGSAQYETLSRDESQRHETAPHPYPYA